MSDDHYMGGPEMAPQTPQPSDRPGKAGTVLDTREVALPGPSARTPQRSDRPGKAGTVLDTREVALPISIHPDVPRPLKIGIGGPVGSGKTALAEALCRQLRDQVDMAVITNDIYTKEDAEYLVRRGALPSERVLGVETGGCPHTAIREDASVNLEAIAQLLRTFPALELLIVESGGDNLAATFSPELVDATIYVIDVAAGEKIPRKGGPGITRSDLLVINKIDLAPYVGADLAVMDRDARRMRGDRPFVFTNLRSGEGVDAIVHWIRHELLLAPA